MIFKGYVFALLYGFLCLFLGFIAYKCGMPKKYTRKLVHILVGFEWVILYTYFGSSIHFLAVALSFTALLTVAYFARLTPMISSDGNNAPGTVYYGVAMSIMALISLFAPEMLLPFGIGVFATSFGDGFAGLFGQLVKRGNPKVYGEKTLIGVFVNFAVSFLIALAFRSIYDMHILVSECLLVAVFSSCVELISSYGLDNISVTLGVSFLVYFIENCEWYAGYIIPIILTPIIIAFVLEKKALTLGATALAVVLDITVTVSLGNKGFLLLLLFLAGGVIIDKIKEKKLFDDGITKKGSCRDHMQVLANGLFPMITATAALLFKSNIFVVAYVACLSEALADTAASGFGVFSVKTFDLFKWRSCERGISGGVSFWGTVAAFLASFIIPTLALVFNMIDVEMFFVSSLVAFLGVVFDTFLGSVLQVKYRCTSCGKITEREVHCHTRTEYHSGIKAFDNDAVNLLSGGFATTLAAAAMFLI